MMQAVLLAAGKSTRTYPLTLNKPKALLPVANTTIIEHNLSQLAGLVDEVIVVLGFAGEQIAQRLGSHYRHIAIKYVEQPEQKGTADALRAAKPLIRGRFVVLMADDLYSKQDIERCMKHQNAVLGMPVDDLSNFGALIVKNGALADVIEKPRQKIEAVANTGCYVFSKKIFDVLNVRKSTRGELELTDALKRLARTEKVIVEPAHHLWVPVTFSWSLLAASEAVLGRMHQQDITGTIERYVTIKGPVVIGKNTLIKSGAYIEGPVVIGENCVIGPNCYVRAGTSIGNNCKVGNGCEVKNSILMDGVRIDHLSYVGDSVLGERAHLGAGTMIANLRHDGQAIKSPIGRAMVDTGRKKLGAILGDGAQTGVNTSIYPGRKMWPGTITRPGAQVEKDIK